MDHQVVVVGAGAAGMMAAGRAAELGAHVLLLEKTDGPGKKILISGKTRCNLTNSRPLDQFIAMYGPNGRFLYGAFSRFFREELLSLLRRYGVETKEERGGRIFPASDDSRDVVMALRRYLDSTGVRLVTRARVTSIRIEGGRVTGVHTHDGFHPARAVVLATGGASWPGTGSSGDGYRMAAALGHTIVPLRPALVPLAVRQVDLARSMQGVSLRNVRLTSFTCPSEEVEPSLIPDRDVGGRGMGGRRPRPPVIESRLGEMLITHFGIGGPITLLMSLAVVDALQNGPVSVAVDLKPGLTCHQLRQRLQRDLEAHSRRSYRSILSGLLPRKMVEPFVGLTGIPGDKPAHRIVAEERERLLEVLKCLRFDVDRPLPLSRAIVTAGGVSLDQIDPRDLSSRIIGGLHLCGEVMDIDADTGGYNLQAAFSTGYVAGEAAAGKLALP
ncbi:MAG: aminoacetone oxidase family FAD-binding enzyme [Anaerolineae bacterium]|nr:aminoacetone oxidase family FAD-binding enzyme [Anaerolineae bacterium]